MSNVGLLLLRNAELRLEVAQEALDNATPNGRDYRLQRVFEARQSLYFARQMIAEERKIEHPT